MTPSCPSKRAASWPPSFPALALCPCPARTTSCWRTSRPGSVSWPRSHSFLEAEEAQECGRAPQPPQPAAFPELTAREREVLELIAEGLDNTRDRRRTWSLSPKTVRNHITVIFSKLQVENRAQAIVRAREAGLGREPRPYRALIPRDSGPRRARLDAGNTPTTAVKNQGTRSHDTAASRRDNSTPAENCNPLEVCHDESRCGSSRQGPTGSMPTVDRATRRLWKPCRASGNG